MKLLSYWQDSIDERRDYRGRDVPAEVDVAIVGGGLAAALTATKRYGAEAATTMFLAYNKASDSNHLLYDFRMTDDDRLLFGGRARFAISSPSADLRSGEILRKGMSDLFPQLAGTRLDYCGGGLVDMTMDQMVHAGRAQGIPYSAGCSGHGVQMATHMGVYLGQRLTGGGAENPWEDLPVHAVPGHFGPPCFLPPVGAYVTLLDRVS